MNFVVDTHALIWYFEDSRRLGKEAEKVLSNPESILVCPTIVLAELLFFLRKKKIPRSFDTFYRAISTDRRFIVYPLDEQVILNIPQSLEMHDGVIVATAIVWKDRVNDEVGIITKDEKILQLESVRTVW